MHSASGITADASLSGIGDSIRPGPRVVKVIEPETIARRSGYAAPHTVHCGPDGILLGALGAPDGNGIALGHAASVAVVLVTSAAARLVVPLAALKVLVVGALMSLLLTACGGTVIRALPACRSVSAT